MALEALAGDRHCIKNLAGLGQVAMEEAWKRGGNLAEAAWWLAQILGDIYAGKSPNEAFGFEQGVGSRDPARWKLEDFEKLQRQWMLAHHVAALVQEFEGKSYGSAVDTVCAAWSVTRREAEDAMCSVVQNCTSLSAVQAKGLALDVVSEFGAGNARGSRSLIEQAYTDYSRQD